MTTRELTPHLLHSHYKRLQKTKPEIYEWFEQLSFDDQLKLDEIVKQFIYSHLNIGPCGALELVFELGQALNGRRIK